MHSPTSDNPKRGLLSFFILAVVSASTILFVSQKESLTPLAAYPRDPVIAAFDEVVSEPHDASMELASLYEKLHQQEMELEKKDQELEELASLFQTSIARSHYFKNFSLQAEAPLRDVLGFPLEQRNLAPLGGGKNAVKEAKVKKAKKDKKKVPKKDDEIVENKGRSLYFERKCQPQDFLPNINSVSTPGFLSPQLSWNFNRGLSTVSKTIDDSHKFPVMVSVFTEPTKKIFQVAQLEISPESLAQIENNDPVQFLGYNASNLNNQDTTSETTSVTNLVEYYQDKDTLAYFPVSDNNSYIWSLIGLESGQVNKCKVFIGSEVQTTTSCTFEVENVGEAIADMLYIPQNNFVVMLTVKNVMLGYKVTWSNSEPYLNYFGQLDSLDECYEGDSEDSSDKEDNCNELPSPRSMSGMFVDEDNTFIYLCAPMGLLAFSLNLEDSNSPFVNVNGDANNWIGSNFCVQSVPTPYGLYFHSQMDVRFIPFVQYDPQKDSEVPSFAMFGTPNPEVYVVYRRFTPTDEVGSSSSDESGEDTYDLITSIAFSPNTNNVVGGRSTVTGKEQSFYVGGALVIATIRYDDTVVTTSDCLSGKFNKDDATPQYGLSCPGSLVLNDICKNGENTAFVNDLIDGPAYGLSVDNNMNILTQNGQGGISYFSVAYSPGHAQDGVFLANLVDPCSGAKLKSILATVLAGAAIIMGLLAIPLTGGASTALVFGGLAVGGVGAAVPFM